MTTVTLNLPTKFEFLIKNKNLMNNISTYLIEDYLAELYEDTITKKKLENNEYDKSLNLKIEKLLGI